ncbi:hypothetical protein QYF61_015453 [Mycteria americana]|uniref:Uncharacterized protein n=1 Tax=Mycteria americana TaxID=33587 RepID=A0AAN7NSE1_MYCAM|nr:hypothetical protein QYF61_015453 [Mycteria americana]
METSSCPAQQERLLCGYPASPGALVGSDEVATRSPRAIKGDFTALEQLVKGSGAQAKQPQFPQPLLIRLLLQTFHQLRCPSLVTLQHLNVLLVLRDPKLNTGFKVQPHQCQVQGHDHFPSPAGRTISDTSQEAVGFLGYLGTLLAHVQPAVKQHPQVLFCLAAFQPLFPKPVALHGVVVTQVQDPALGLVEPHTIDLSLWIQPVQVPLQSLPPFKQINTPTQFGVICKLSEGALDPFIQIIDKDIKQDWPQKSSIDTLLIYGLDEQRVRWIENLMNGWI